VASFITKFNGGESDCRAVTLDVAYLHKDATNTNVSPCSFFPTTRECYTYVSFTKVIPPLIDPAQPPTNETRMLSTFTANPAAARKGNLKLRHKDSTTLQPANQHSVAG